MWSQDEGLLKIGVPWAGCRRGRAAIFECLQLVNFATKLHGTKLSTGLLRKDSNPETSTSPESELKYDLPIYSFSIRRGDHVSDRDSDGDSNCDGYCDHDGNADAAVDGDEDRNING